MLKSLLNIIPGRRYQLWAFMGTAVKSASLILTKSRIVQFNHTFKIFFWMIPRCLKKISSFLTGDLFTAPWRQSKDFQKCFDQWSHLWICIEFPMETIFKGIVLIRLFMFWNLCYKWVLLLQSTVYQKRQ